MAPLFKKKRAVQVKLESVKGTEETTGLTDILVFDPDLKFTGEFVKRNGAGKYMGNTVAGVVNGRTGEMTFEMELQTDGTQKMGAGLIILLQACGLKEATANTVYRCSSVFADHKTVTIRLFEDGKLKVLYGASGTFTLEGEQPGIVRLKFTFKGIRKTDSDVALPATFAPLTRAPHRMVGMTFTVGGTARRISKLSLDIGAEVSPRQNAAAINGFGIDHFLVSDFDTQVEFNPEEDLIATDDHLLRLMGGTTQAVSIAFSDGIDKITIALPVVQMKEAADGDRDGVSTYEVKGQCLHSSGDDAVTFTVSAST